MILAGDIGGTKTVLALCDGDGGGAPRIVREHSFPSADFPSLEAIVAKFVTGDDAKQLRAACFGVAGPVVGGSAKITNLPWTITARVIGEQLGAIPVTLLNDLQATALGTLVLPDAAFEVLQAGKSNAPRNDAGDRPTIAVLAPGTGLGEAWLVATGDAYRALPTEGGHADFAPSTDDELELLRYLRARHGVHVSNERVLCGAGLVDLYGFTRQQSGAAEPAWLTEQLASHDRAAVVSQAALDGRDPACARALEIFVDLLAAEASNMALRGLTTGGVVIGGGIPPKILPALKTGRFVARFNAKGRFGDWTGELAVRVALEPRAALLGAAHHASTAHAASSASVSGPAKDSRS
ncbi:MAG TPA: glucokinase [Kofleriaceae bacterium]|nr:glucokinase [Kofleriaceae bacterium]